MELTWLYTTVSLFFLALAYKFLSLTKTRRRPNLPPSPPSIPVIGHLHLLKPPLHRTLHRLSQTYGPIFSLRFGTRQLVVVSSPSAVEECFTKNDVVLSNRPPFMIGKYIGYNYSTVVAAPYGDHWRNLRRLATVEIFSSSRLNSFISIRRDETKLLLRKLYQISNSNPNSTKIELKSKLSDLTFNVILRTIAGKRYYGDELEDSEEAKRSRDLIGEIFKYGGVSNPGDFLPILRWIDYKNLEKNLGELSKKMDLFLQGLIDEHRRDDSNNSMIDHLLTLQQSQPEYYTDQIIKGLMVVNMRGDDVHSIGSWADSECCCGTWTEGEPTPCPLHPYDPEVHTRINASIGYIPFDPALLDINPYENMDFPNEEELDEEEDLYMGRMVDDALMAQWENDDMWEPWEDHILQDVVPERHNAVFVFVDDFLTPELVPYRYVHLSYLLFRLQCPLPASAFWEPMPIVRIVTMFLNGIPAFLPHQLFHGLGPYIRPPLTPPREDSPLRIHTPLSLSPSGSPLAWVFNSLETPDLFDDVLAAFRLFWERESSSLDFTSEESADYEEIVEEEIFILED